MDGPVASPSLLVFVCGVVVQNHMHRKGFGHFAVDVAQEFQELFVAMLVHARTDRGPGEHVHANSVVVPCLL